MRTARHPSARRRPALVVGAALCLAAAACDTGTDGAAPADNMPVSPETAAPSDTSPVVTDLPDVDPAPIPPDPLVDPPPDGGRPGAVLPRFEPWRPVVHYAPPFGWMNDPNGLSVVNGRFHLYFQYNPLSVDFGDIGWGHAVSDDLIEWETWPVAIRPDPGALIFSGSLVHDERGTSPLCEPEQEQPCLVAVYTTHRATPDGSIQTQDVAVSTNDGVGFAKFDGNPVLDLDLADFRDPKVFWHDGTERWIMVIVLPVERQVVLFASADLVEWEELSRFGPVGAVDGIWECPDLFPAPVVATDAPPDAPREQRWVMKVDLNPGHVAGGSGGQYFLGTFDGTTFVADEPDAPAPRWIDWGRDFYCATTFHGGADDEGRPLWLGWMNDWTYASELPTFPWRGSMTLPRRLELTLDAEGTLALTHRLPSQIDEAFGIATTASGTAADVAEQLASGTLDLTPPLLLTISADPGASSGVGLRLVDGTGSTVAEVDLDLTQRLVTVARLAEANAGPDTFAGVTPGAPMGDSNSVMVLVDRTSVEVFADDGRSSVTMLLLPDQPITVLGLEAFGGDGAVDLSIRRMPR
jgi:fructan beta-fructosidase